MGLPSEKVDYTISFEWHIVNPLGSYVCKYGVCIFLSEEQVEVKCGGCGMKLERTGSIT